MPRYFWPKGAPDQLGITALLRAFETIGYVECPDGDLEAGYEKLALYNHQSVNGETHAARQLENGWWVSKFGGYKDLEHKTAESIESQTGYKLQKWMKRPRDS